MSERNSINRNIPIELDTIIVSTQKKLSPITEKIEGKKMTYIGAARMIALKLKKYTLPFTNEVFQELIKVAKENTNG